MVIHDIEEDPQFDSSSRWKIRAFVLLLMLSTLAPIEWYRNPRIRAQFYHVVFILGDAELRDWSIDKLRAYELSEQEDILADCYLFALIDGDKTYLDDLPGLGSHPEISIHGLANGLSQTDPEIQICLLKTLGNQGPRAAPAVPALIKQLSHLNLEVRCYALEALANIGPGAKDAVPRLIALLSNSVESRMNRARAARALGKIGPNSAPAVPALVKCTEVGDETMTLQSIQALGLIGPKAAFAVPALLKILKTESQIAIETFDDKDDLWILEGPVSTITVITALGKIGAAAAPAVPTLSPLLVIPWAREETIIALGNIGPKAASAVPKLILLLSDEFEDFQERAIVTLGKIDRRALPALQKARKSQNLTVSENAQRAIAIIEAKKEDSRVQLTKPK